MDLYTYINRYLSTKGQNEQSSSIAGNFKLIFDDDIEIDIASDLTQNVSLLLHASIGMPDPAAKSEFYERLLEVNFLSRQYHDAFVSLNSATGEIAILSKYNSKSITYDEFETMLESFAEQCRYWKDFILREFVKESEEDEITEFQERGFAGFIDTV